jgi:hypothetical protein
MSSCSGQSCRVATTRARIIKSSKDLGISPSGANNKSSLLAEKSLWAPINMARAVTSVRAYENHWVLIHSKARGIPIEQSVSARESTGPRTKLGANISMHSQHLTMVRDRGLNSMMTEALSEHTRFLRLIMICSYPPHSNIGLWNYGRRDCKCLLLTCLEGWIEF